MGGFPTDVVEGFVTELNSHGQLYRTVSRPLKLGVSVGVKGKRGAGTLGAIVKDSADKMYVLSCEHVFNPVPSGEKPQIQQPASIDYENHIVVLEKELDKAKNSESKNDLDYTKRKLQEIKNLKPRVIGSYTKGIKQNVSFNGSKYYVDAALALVQLPEEEQLSLINEGTKLCENTYEITSYGQERELINTEVEVPTTNGNYKPVAELSQRIELHKCGRTTGLTAKGKIIDGNIFLPKLPREENGTSGYSWCYNCLRIESELMKPFSNDGDSGSLVLDEEGNACALIFAKLKTVFATWSAIACPIELVLEKLGSLINSELTIIGLP